MRIEINFFKKIEMEVDDKFNILAVDDPNYEPIAADDENALFNEFIQQIEESTGKQCAWKYEKAPFNEAFISGVYRTSDNSPILEW